MRKVIPEVVSVVLVNFRGPDDTIAAIENLQKLNWPKHLLEIIVVENGSGDDSFQRLQEIPGKVRIIESKKNLGFAGGCNLGVRYASGEFLAFLNNDARPDKDWVKTAVETFHSGKDIGAVASKVLNWNGQQVDFVDAAVTWYGMGYKPHAGENDKGAWDSEKDVLFGTGAAMFVRATIFEKLEGFDENYFMFYEDVDLGWRINLLGYRFRFQPKSLVFHKHHASMNKFGDFREFYLLERNALFTLYKNLDDLSLSQVFPGAVLLAARRATARGKLDTTRLDLRNPGDDNEPDMLVSKSTMAGIFALDQFIELLPSLVEERAKVQSSRTVSDRQLRQLFGNVDEPAFPIEKYLRGYEKITGALGILDIPSRRRVLIITGDPIGQRMAGPAIRAWNMAKVLARENDVRLLSTTSAVSVEKNFEVGVISQRRPKSAIAHEEWADVIIVQGHALQHFPAFEATQKVLIVDIYDPLHLEQLEQGRGQSMKRWNDQVIQSTDALNHQLALGDFFLCASERQRHFWLGQLSGLGRINPYTYSRDNGLDSLLAVVPFGITREEPEKLRPAIRGVIPGISDDDKVIIWAGGIYNWFDPETLIRAVGQLAKSRPNVRLFFMGVKHPNPDVPEMAAVSRAKMLAVELGIDGKNVFFNESWVPYEERQNYLLDADIGVSTHFNHVETTYSFRTRILDYLWAGLPIISTGGDSFGDMVAEEHLGVMVPERSERALVDAMEALLFDSKQYQRARKNVFRVREDFVWDEVLKPLLEFCRNPVPAADKPVGENAPLRTRLAQGASKRKSSNHSGWRRDFERIAYYLQNGGIGAVAERYNARRERVRDAKGL